MKTGARRTVAAIVAALTAPLFMSDPVADAATEVLPYEVAVTDAVDTPLTEFRDKVVETLDDPRGWELGGTIDLRYSDDDGLFTVVLASPAEVEAAAPICSSDWSCRVGDRALINEQRWTDGTIGYPLPIDDYRSYVVNHEVGHWLGVDHRDCPGFDEPAPVMMQQSKSIGGCNPTVWPVPEEQQALAAIRGVDVARQTVLRRGDRGAGVAEWQQHLNEIARDDLVVDGWFGPNTEQETIDWQRFFLLEDDGVAADEERSIMNTLLREKPRRLTQGMLGPDVTDWQRDFRRLGFDIVIDGWFGPQTRDRTLTLQREFAIPATGMADPRTRDVVDGLLTYFFGSA